ncbi:MAG: tyrosine-type recombinase/integrase [Bacteriovoracaceae bacterium]
MSGKVMPDLRSAVCEHCKSGKYVQSYQAIIDHDAPICNKCHKLPTKLKLRKVIPDMYGKGVAKDFRYALDGSRLANIADALTLKKQLNEDLKNNTFMPSRYGSQKERDSLKFENFCEIYLKDYDRRSELPVEHDEFITPSALARKKGLIKNHLKPYFGKMYLENINYFNIKDFYSTYKTSLRSRDLALGELKVILKFAWQEKGLISQIPAFPKLKRSKKKESDDIPTAEQQALIIKNVSNEKYRFMLIVNACFAMRQCEVRALKVKDFDYENRVLTIQRHFSDGGKGKKNIEIDGRKSIKKSEVMGTLKHKIVNEDILCNLFFYCIDKEPDDYIFEGHISPYVSHTALADAWKKSCLELMENKKIKEIQKKYKLYDGTRHTTLTDLASRVTNLNEIKQIGGHTTIVTSERYIHTRDEDNNVYNLLNGEKLSC